MLPESCPVLTARVRLLAAMARLGKASTGPGAESNPVPVVLFLRDASDPGPAPEVKQQSVERALKARGLRATARVLPIRTKTVMTECTNRPRPSTRQAGALTGRASRAHPRGKGPCSRTRSTARPHGRVGRNVEVRAPPSAPAVALARDRSAQWSGARRRLWETARHSLLAAQSPLGALWHQAVFYGWVGGLSAASRRRAARSGEGHDAANREQTPRSPHAEQAMRASNELLCQDRTQARSRAGPLHQSVRIWATSLI